MKELPWHPEPQADSNHAVDRHLWYENPTTYFGAVNVVKQFNLIKMKLESCVLRSAGPMIQAALVDNSCVLVWGCPRPMH